MDYRENDIEEVDEENNKTNIEEGAHLDDS
jgi:hypothetical protein